MLGPARGRRRRLLRAQPRAHVRLRHRQPRRRQRARGRGFRREGGGVRRRVVRARGTGAVARRPAAGGGGQAAARARRAPHDPRGVGARGPDARRWGSHEPGASPAAASPVPLPRGETIFAKHLRVVHQPARFHAGRRGLPGHRGAERVQPGGVHGRY